MLRRSVLVPLLIALALGISGAIYAQLETSERGILPLDTSNTLEIGGIHVDVGGADAQSARYAGWRIAQRQGFRALWAKMHNAPINQAPARDPQPPRFARFQRAQQFVRPPRSPGDLVDLFLHHQWGTGLHRGRRFHRDGAVDQHPPGTDQLHRVFP